MQFSNECEPGAKHCTANLEQMLCALCFYFLICEGSAETIEPRRPSKDD